MSTHLNFTSTTLSTPRVNKQCPNVDTFLYEPANCDEGYWCGCSDPEGRNCAPSNDLNATNWAGHFTVTESDGTKKVLTGWASIYPTNYFQCADTLHCPGRSNKDADFCPTLCEAGHYCPSPTQQLPCPEGHYCLMGSVEPTPCDGLESCSAGSHIYSSMTIFGVVTAAAVALYGALLLTSHRLRSGKRKSTTGPSKISAEPEVHQKDCESQDERRESTVTTQGPSQMINVAFQDLQLTLPNGKCIMQGVSGKLEAGSFCAIMGPSGAGKSTFLSLISGKNERTGGKLIVNGEEQSLSKFRRLVGFVPQEDTMLRELTVYDNIRHAAMMRLPSSWTTQRKLDRVEAVLESLDLDHVRDSIIGDEIRRGISGGQRKRVNVAMELVADPAMICLDEPTSGLDSTSSTSLCETLRALARTGVNVSAVLHQPKNEIFEMFDTVLLLGVGGRTVYLGPATDMTSYFTRIGFPLPPRTNPADYYMDVVAGLIPCENDLDFHKEDLFHLWNTAEENPDREDIEESDDSEESSTGTKSKEASTFAVYVAYWSALFTHVFGSTGSEARRVPGILGQTALLFRRAFLQRIREPANTFWPLLLSIFAGGVNGIASKAYGLDPSHSGNPIYYGVPWPRLNATAASSQFLQDYPIPSSNNIVAIWQNTALVIMLVCVLGINVFGRERAVFFRDAASGTKVAAYWAAKTLEIFLWLPLYSAVFSATAYCIQPLVMSFLDYWVNNLMVFIGFYGLGGCASIVIGPENRGIVTLVSGLVLILMFTGFLFEYQGKPYFKIFYTFWTGQTFCSRNYEGYDAVFNTEYFNELGSGYDLENSFGFNIGMSFVSGFGWHFLTLILLKVVDFRKQR